MKKQPKNWLIFSGLAFQIGTVMYIMIYFGGWIQEKWEISSKWPTLVTSSIGLVLVLLIIIKQANRSWIGDFYLTQVFRQAPNIDDGSVLASHFCHQSVGIYGSRRAFKILLFIQYVNCTGFFSFASFGFKTRSLNFGLGFPAHHWTEVFAFFNTDIPKFSGWWTVTKARIPYFFYSLCCCHDPWDPSIDKNF